MAPRVISYDSNISPIPTEAGSLRDPPFAVGIRHDPLMDRLVRALLPEDEAREVLRGFYTDALHTTLLRRLARLRGDEVGGSARRKSSPLPSWRLRRVYEYVEARQQDKIRLADMANAAGLSSMHFAAQFRMATGFRPHDYVVHRRIQRAKALLSGSDMAIIDIALSLGFQTQSHFTTVFRRIAGFTPRSWREFCSHASEAGCGERPTGEGRGCFGEGQDMTAPVAPRYAAAKAQLS